MSPPPDPPPKDPPEDEAEALLAAASTAWRPDDPSGGIAFHPAWQDLDAAGREKVYELIRSMRALEARSDAAGLSTTAKAVLAKIRRAPR